MEHVATPFRTSYGDSVLHVFAFGAHEEDNILCITAGDFTTSRLVRVQSACYTAEIFRAVDCDCHEQLHVSLGRIHQEGGALVYMIADGRGAGLVTKVRGLALGASEGLDTYDAYRRLGVEPDPRTYSRVAEVLRHVGISDVRLLTNNPRKLEGLADEGIHVIREPLEVEPTEDSLSYLATKKSKFGHLLRLVDDFGDTD